MQKHRVIRSYEELQWCSNSINLSQRLIAILDAELKQYKSQGKNGRFSIPCKWLEMIGPAYNNLGLGLERIGLRKEALENYSKAIDINGRDAAALGNLFRAYGKLGREDDAITCLIDAVNRCPSNNVAWYLMGLLMEEKEEYEQAFYYFQQFLEHITQDLPELRKRVDYAQERIQALSH